MRIFFVILFTFYSMNILSKNATDFKLINQNNEFTQLEKFKGKVIVLEWFNHDCPFVKKHYQSKNMQKIQKEFVDKGVIWLSIISSAKNKQGYLTPGQAKKRINVDKMNSSFLLLDTSGDVGRLYGAKTTPHMFVIDQSFNVVFDGPIDNKPSTSLDDIKDSKIYIIKILNDLLAGKKVKYRKMKPYGCSVKY